MAERVTHKELEERMREMVGEYESRAPVGNTAIFGSISLCMAASSCVLIDIRDDLTRIADALEKIANPLLKVDEEGNIERI